MPIGAPYPMAPAEAVAAAAQKLSSSQLCGARTRQGGPCGQIAMRNGRCRFHGGLSTGRRTAEGIEAHREAVTRHGGRSREMAEFRRAMRELRADARKLAELA